MSKTFDLYRERRLERMRLGQATCEIVELKSDPEIRFALVPMTDGDYQQALTRAMKVAAEENEHGLVLRDRVQQNSIIMYAAREVDDLEIRMFESYDEVAELESHDVNYVWDIYREMVAQISPEMDGISEEDWDELKKVFANLQRNELSGRQWYALQRFLTSLTPQQLLGKSFGSSSTNQLTTTSESSKEPVTDADTSGIS
jgi:hypothetical protein